MDNQRDIGKEILEAIEEIKQWQRGEKKLKVTRIALPTANDVADVHHKSSN